MKTLKDYIAGINLMPMDALGYTAPEAMEGKVWELLRRQGWKDEDLKGKFSLMVKGINARKKQK